MWCLSGRAGSVASGAACALCVDLLMNPLINISCSDAMASMHRIGVTSRGPACRTERCRVSCSASPPGAPSKFATCSCNGDAGNACVRRQPQVAPPPPLPPPLPPAAHAEFPSFHLCREAQAIQPGRPARFGVDWQPRAAGRAGQRRQSGVAPCVAGFGDGTCSAGPFGHLSAPRLHFPATDRRPRPAARAREVPPVRRQCLPMVPPRITSADAHGVGTICRVGSEPGRTIRGSGTPSNGSMLAVMHPLTVSQSVSQSPIALHADPRRPPALSAPHCCCSFTRAVDDPERASRGGWVFDAPEPVFGCRDLR